MDTYQLLTIHVQNIYIRFYQYVHFVVKMSELVNLDKFGKIFIPKRFRSQLKETKFMIRIQDDNIILEPVKDPSMLFGSLDKLKRSDLDKVHEDEEHEDIA